MTCISASRIWRSSQPMSSASSKASRQSCSSSVKLSFSTFSFSTHDSTPPSCVRHTVPCHASVLLPMVLNLEGPPARRKGCSDPANSIRSLRLYGFHVVVGKAEMMADLVYQHVPDHVREVLAGLAPIVEDRPAIEKNHVRHRSGVGVALMRQRDSAIEAEQVERAFETHLALRFLIRKILDP